MKKRTILTAFLLLAVLSLISLSSCDKTDMGPMIDLYRDGQTPFTIIRAEEADGNGAYPAIKLRKALSALSDFEFSIDTDWIKRGEEIPADAYEILVGNTNRPETAQVLKRLKARDYIISFQGNKIVIVGGNDDLTLQAVDYFLKEFCGCTDTENFEQAAKIAAVQVPESYEYIFENEYAVDSLKLDGNDISDYVIVYREGLADGYNAAFVFREKLKHCLGYILEILPERESDSPLQIVIGDSAAAPSSPIGFSISGGSGTLFLSGKSELGIVYASEYFAREILKSDTDIALKNDVALDLSGLALTVEPEDFSPVRSDSSGTALETVHSLLLLSPEGELMGLYDKRDGKNYADKNKPSFLFQLAKSGNPTIVTSQFRIHDDGSARAVFGKYIALDFRVTARDDFFYFELLDELTEEYLSLRMLNTALTHVPEAEDSFSALSYVMSYQVNPNTYPDGISQTTGATCFSKFGTKGSKVAFLAAPLDRHRDIMKLVNADMKKGEVPVSAIGGANALDHDKNYGNYIIVSDSDRSLVDGWIGMSNTYGIDQIDFHRGGNTMLNGSFRFTKYESAADFKKSVADPLMEAGIQTGLHTYSFYIDASDADILADPKWQSQLEVLETFTLAEDLKKFNVRVKVVEDVSKVSLDFAFFNHNSMYLLIDEEIVKYTSLGEREFIVARGVCGTTPAEHTAGTTVRHLGGVFGLIAPDINSELFLQIARNTAAAYNEGGFAMIYLDALDGISRHASSSETWYYTALFVNEILKYTETDPIMEYSTMYPSIWIARGRAGAWDHAQRGYKRFNDAHIEANLSWMQKYYTTTLGWYHLYPVDKAYPGNTNVRYQYFDDIDYMASLSVAYDMSIAFNGSQLIDTVPAYKRNMERYGLYTELRKTGYFSEKIKALLQNNREHEYALTQKEDGSYAFVQKQYAKTKLFAINTEGRSEISAVNPYGAQQPFLRIEGHYSSTGENPILLLGADETKEAAALSLSNTFEGERNLKENLAVKLRVKGNNSGDALCIRLNCNSNSDSSVADYVIRLNYEGWREFVFTELDNGEFSDLMFPGKTDATYAFYRGLFNFDRVTGIQVFFSGKCEGVFLSDITACAYLENSITNPTVKIDGQAITFNGTVGSSEYLEYFPGESSALIYDSVGNSREVTVTGALPEIAQGSFTAIVSGKAQASAPLRATVTFGFTGEEVAE